MGFVPQPFGTIPSQALANYDFTEFTSKEGYVTFYPYDAASGALVDNQALTSNANMYSSGGYITSSFTDKRFPANFNAPNIINGKAFINLWSIMKNNFGSPQTLTNTCSCAIVKIDSSNVVTHIASGAAVTHTATSLATGTTSSQVLSWAIDLPETGFGYKDKLVLSVTATANGSQSPFFCGIGTDPMNRTVLSVGTFDGSSSRVLIPFKIDLS